MFEIVFKCPSCRVHLSASGDDAGYHFDCPSCGAAISVPSGDILFTCSQCHVNLLANSDSVGERFDCPQCHTQVSVPSQGKAIAIPDPPRQPKAFTPPRSPDVSDASPRQVDATPLPTQETDVDRQFMTTWGDYIAHAGLADEQDQKNDGKKK